MRIVVFESIHSILLYNIQTRSHSLALDPVYLLCTGWTVLVTEVPFLSQKQSMLRLTQIRFARLEMTVSKRKISRKIFLKLSKKLVVVVCYGAWWNVELLWGLLISPGWSTDMMWIVQQKLWKTIYLANGRHTIPPTHSSFLKFESLQKNFFSA